MVPAGKHVFQRSFYEESYSVMNKMHLTVFCTNFVKNVIILKIRAKSTSNSNIRIDFIYRMTSYLTISTVKILKDSVDRRNMCNHLFYQNATSYHRKQE